MEVKEVLDVYLKARDELKSLAHRQYTEDNCPLNSGGLDHSDLAQAIWEAGNEWNCEFCGELFF